MVSIDEGRVYGARLVRLEATLSPSTVDTISGHAADTFAQLTAKYNDAKIDTAIASPISTNQRSPYNRPVPCMIKIRTAKLARSQRRRCICECSVVRELEHALEFGVDVCCRLVRGGGDGTAGRPGEGAAGQETFVEFVCVDVEAFPVLNAVNAT